VGGSVVKARREIGQINDEWRFVNRRLVEYAWADSLLPNQMTTFTGKIESIITNPEWRASRERLAELRPIARITLK